MSLFNTYSNCIIFVSNKTARQMKIKKLVLDYFEHWELTSGFRTDVNHCLCMYCCAVLLKADGLSVPQVGAQTEMAAQAVGSWGKCFESRGIQRLYIRFGQGRKAIMDCLDEEVVHEPSSWNDRVYVQPKKLDRKLLLDNASVCRNEKIKRMCSIWEKRGRFIFYIPPYSLRLNIVETFWCIIKGKWVRPQRYVTAELLFYAINRASAAVGTQLNINSSNYVARVWLVT